MRIAVVVVTYKRAIELSKTIQAIFEQGISRKDIIVINNSKDDQSTHAFSQKLSDINWFHLPENIASAGGFAFGLQKGMELGYDWVWLFNDDSRPKINCLEAALPHLSAFTKQGNVGFLKITEKVKENKTVLLFWKGVRVPKYVDISDNPVETDLITFDGCFVSKNLMEKIGFCDPKFFMGTYEFEYCLRAKDAGFKIYTLPNGMIEDEKKGAASGTPPWRQYYNTRNHLWLALHRRSLYIFQAWLIRELKYTYAIICFGNKKRERLLFKYRAIRDAILSRRGKTYHPDNLLKVK